MESHINVRFDYHTYLITNQLSHVESEFVVAKNDT